MNKAIVSKNEEVVVEAANANQPSQANLALRKKQGGFVSMEVIAMWAVVLAVAIGGLIGVNKVRADNSAKNLGCSPRMRGWIEPCHGALDSGQVSPITAMNQSQA